MFRLTSLQLAPRITAAFLALAGTLFLAWQARQLYLHMTHPISSTHVASNARQNVDPADLQRLFPATAPSAPVLSAQAAVLLGCVVATDPEQSHAVIRIQDQGARAVFTGEEFLPGMRVTEIHHDHLLFSYQGGSARLDFVQDATPAADAAG